MKKMILRITALALLLLLQACAAPDVGHYAANTPVFDPVQFFAGRTEAWGMFQRRDGEVVKRFEVIISGAEKRGNCGWKSIFVTTTVAPRNASGRSPAQPMALGGALPAMCWGRPSAMPPATR